MDKLRQVVPFLYLYFLQYDIIFLKLFHPSIGGLSGGAIAAIVIFVLVSVAAGVAFFIQLRKHN